jgi:serine/threonine-protein kinase
VPSALNSVAYDPNSVVHHLEAWMPEKIAAYKLRGFVQDAEGELIESVPGRIRVRVGGRGTPYASRGSTWFGLGRKSGLIEVDLHLQRPDPTKDNQLRITVVMRPLNGSGDADWRSRCTQVFIDLRAYLMGQNG